MYLDMVRIDEKVMESCWYSLCVYKKKKRDTKLHCGKRRNEKLKKKCKPKKYMNSVVAKIRMKKDVPKRYVPSYVLY